jgi:bla regulator protein blaR1
MINNLFSSIKSLAEPVSWAIIHSLWQGALIVVVLTIALILLRKKSPNFRYAVSCMALAGIVLLFIGTVFYIGAESNTSTTLSSLHGTENPTPVDLQFERSGTGISSTIQLAETGQTIMQKLESYIPGIFQLWMLGVMLLSIYHIIGWNKTRQLTRVGTQPLPQKWQERFSNLCNVIGIKHQIQIVKSSLVQMPCVIGWIKPVVLLPLQVFTGLNDDQLEMVIIHELAHVRRIDCLVNYLQAAAETLMYFNPAVWWISKQIRTERELCCDDLAVKVSGNKLLYAKALVNLEEMRQIEPAFALGIDGSSSLLQRIRRLGGQSMKRHTSFSIFKLTGIIALVIMLTLGVSSINGYTEPEMLADKDSYENRDFKGENEDIHGEWEMKRNHDNNWLRLAFKDGKYRTSFGFNEKELRSMIEQDEDGFYINRDAGRIYFDGQLDLDDPKFKGEGECYFRANPKYVGELKDMGFEIDSYYDIMAMAVHDIDMKFVRGIHDTDYKDITLDRIIEFNIHDVTPEYIANLKEVGQDNIPADKIVQMKIHDVEPEYIKEFHDMGYDDLDFDDLVQMHIHDVEPDYVKAFEEMGYEDIDIEELVQMHIHDVDPEYLKAFELLGLKDIDIDELVQMSIHDVDPEDMQALELLGLKELDVDDLIQMSIHDVDPEFIKAFELLGLKELDMDELIQMSIHDVDPEDVRALELLGLKELDVDELVQMSIHDVDPDYIKALGLLGLKEMDVDELIQMSIHDVDPEFVQIFVDLGLEHIDIDELIQMSIHDVDPEFIKSLSKAGFENLDPEELVQMSIHDIEPEYIEGLAELGYGDLETEDLVQMRIHDVTPEFIKELQRREFKNLTPERLIKIKIHDLY